jgi:hypothetical protein
LLTGQPVWQKGTPQSMQRAPCSRCFSSGKRLVDLKPVLKPLLDLAAGGLFALNLQKSCHLTHAAPLP